MRGLPLLSGAKRWPAKSAAVMVNAHSLVGFAQYWGNPAAIKVCLLTSCILVVKAKAKELETV